MGFKMEIQKTGSTPYILIDEELGYMKLEGESFHENVIEFYGKMEQWMVGFLKEDFGELIFDCELKYFNSSTAKLLMNMLAMMDRYSVSPNKVVVNWITEEENEIIIECGEDFKEEMEYLEFNLIIK